MSNHSAESFDATDFKKDSIKKEPQGMLDPATIVKGFAHEYDKPELGTYSNLMSGLGKLFGFTGAYIPCCCASNPYKEVPQGQVGMITTFGKLTRCVEPGLAYVNTWTEKIDIVNVMLSIRELPEQECFTRDNVSINVTSVVYYNIIDPERAWYSVDNIHQAIGERTQTTLRDVIGSRTVQEIVEKREQIADDIQEIISKTAYDWGVNIESILIKGIHLPSSVQQSLSSAAEAKRLGESKIIKAKAEVESAKLMRKASDILSSKAAMQIRYLEAIQAMAKTSNCKTIFMPGQQEIERVAGFQTSSNNPVDRKQLEEDPEWAEENANHTGNNNMRHIMNTMSIQEGLN